MKANWCKVLSRKQLLRTFFRLVLAFALLAGSAGPAPVTAQGAVASTRPRAAAACNVSGFITANTTWGPELCDPYIVTGSVIVQAGVTLTIEPGTTVKFNSLKAMTVQGTLIARGTEGSLITFTSNVGTNKGDWGYIHFTDTSTDATFDGGGNYTGGSILQYAVVEYAGGASVSENGALRIEASSPYIDHNTVRNNKGSGVYVWSDGAARIANNTITG
ncbi:MAG: hypothetical protein HY328_18555, partial [Chloroflexi bacterium]|nr:hypothetical protein [Chloroflexota bacterium]